MKSFSNFGVLICFGLLPGVAAIAAPLKSARVTQVVKDVKLLPEGGQVKPAVVNDNVPERGAVRTGSESRTELTFSDQTLARLGPDTIFATESNRAHRLRNRL